MSSNCNNIYKILDSVRIDILEFLAAQTRPNSYSVTKERIGKNNSVFAYHLRSLKKHYLIEYTKPHETLQGYKITAKGRAILQIIQQIYNEIESTQTLEVKSNE